MTIPTPDPAAEVMSSGSGSIGRLGWPDFATIIATVISVLAFIWALIRKREGSDSEGKPTTKEAGMEEFKSKIKNLKELTDDLDDSYKELKKEVSSLEDSLEDLDKKTGKDIRRLEEKMDKIIDMMMKLLSEKD